MPIQKEDYSISYSTDPDLGVIVWRDADGESINQSIQFQHGTIPENGINGVTNESVLDLLAMRLRALNKRFPCRENALAITNIEQARMWLDERTRVREAQGVEGQHKNHFMQDGKATYADSSHATRSEQAGALSDQDVSSDGNPTGAIDGTPQGAIAN